MNLIGIVGLFVGITLMASQQLFKMLRNFEMAT